MKFLFILLYLFAKLYVSKADMVTNLTLSTLNKSLNIIASITNISEESFSKCLCNTEGTDWKLTNSSACNQPNFTCICNNGSEGHFCESCKHHYYSVSGICQPCPCLLSQSDGSCSIKEKLKCLSCKNGFTGDLCNECPPQHYVLHHFNDSCIPCNCSHIRRMYEEEKNCDKNLIMECFTCLTFEHRNKCSPFGLNTLLGNSTNSSNDSYQKNLTDTINKPVFGTLSTKSSTNPSPLYSITLSAIIIISLTVTAFILVTVILFVLKSKRINKFIWYQYLHPESDDNNNNSTMKKLRKTKDPYSSQIAINDSDELQQTLDQKIYKGADRNERSLKAPQAIYNDLPFHLDPHLLSDGLEHLTDDNPYRFSHEQNSHHLTNKPILGFLLR